MQPTLYAALVRMMMVLAASEHFVFGYENITKCSRVNIWLIRATYYGNSEFSLSSTFNYQNKSKYDLNS